MTPERSVRPPAGRPVPPRPGPSDREVRLSRSARKRRKLVGKSCSDPLFRNGQGGTFPDDRTHRRGSRGVEQLTDSWQLKAACRGPQAEVFFPPAHAERKEEKLQREDRAKAICKTCSVRVECLEYAVRIREPHGIWGGLNEMERRQYAERRVG